jgi:adenosylhomocysteine nucleosidase
MSEPERPTLVVTALPEELAPILRRLLPTEDSLDGRRVYRARSGGRPLILAVTGDGAKAAALRAARLCEAHRPAALVGLGVAGALSPLLAPLDLVASARLRNGAGGAPPADPSLLASATAAGARAATLLTVAAPVVSAADKKALAATLPGELAAVDMESAAWARAAAGARVPFVVVRAISDAAAEELPAYLAECVGEDGGIRRSEVVRRAVFAPRSIPVLLRMRSRVARCAVGLSDFLIDGLLGS